MRTRSAARGPRYQAALHGFRPPPVFPIPSTPEQPLGFDFLLGGFETSSCLGPPPALSAGPHPHQPAPPKAHRPIRASEGFQHVPVFLHAAAKALLELLVPAPVGDVLVDLGYFLL